MSPLSARLSASRRSAPRRSAVAGAVLLVAGLAATLVTAPAARAADAAEPPVTQAGNAVVTADALPTAQIDGVAWNQVVAGDTVYVGGKFATARPAGAAPGVDTVPRANFVAYTLSTGRITAFAPQFDNQVYGVAVSPNGATLYVAGQFTKVTLGGTTTTRYRLAAFDLATGRLTDFAPTPNYVVKAVVATNSTVYAGGSFSVVAGQTRNRLAAFAARTGALLPWNPDSDNTVNAMVSTPDRSAIVVGGNFTKVGGAAAYGITAVAVGGAGARVPWRTDQTVRDAGRVSAITALSADRTSVYGAGYVYGAGGNLEGAFRADGATGAVTWVQDCHGDTYGVYAAPAAVYTVGHAHDCSTVNGFGQTNPSTYQHAMAWTTTAQGVAGHTASANYQDWYGTPAPSILSWFPDLTTGNVTGKGQAAWTVTGNGRYVVLGGEFPTVNGVGQQGLVRFAVPAQAPKAMGPERSGGQVVPQVAQTGPRQVTLTIPTNWDRDDVRLRYGIYRDARLVRTVAVDSTFWDQPTFTYVDTPAPGPHSYRVYATDPDGNQVRSDGVDIVVT